MSPVWGGHCGLVEIPAAAAAAKSKTSGWDGPSRAALFAIQSRAICRRGVTAAACLWNPSTGAASDGEQKIGNDI